MESRENSYVKIDKGKIINEKCIKWIEKIDECLEICTKSSGCNVKNKDTHKICKIDNYTSYEKIHKYFE